MARLSDGDCLAFDPWLHTVDEIRQLTKLLEPKGIEITYWDNMVDEVWEDRPARPTAPMRVFPDSIAGKTAAEKCDAVAEDLKAAGHKACVITLPDSICWLLNIRGSDMAHNPLVHCFAVVHDTGSVDLFSDAPADEAVVSHLGARVTRHTYDRLLEFFETLTGKIRIDPKSAPLKVEAHLSGQNQLAPGAPEPVDGPDPCVMPKARKTEAEITATREAHLRDGAAMVEFLAWFDSEAPKGDLTEIDAAKSLEGFRRATNALQEISFDTISGAGPNGAIVHYRVTEDTNRPIRTGELYLVDSGGQYIDGTTDITRTLVVGEPSAEHRAAFTRVLQGMIAISRARFPRGLAGRDLDALARAPLWMAGQDYDHGTGHGVGVFLNVHEGPQRLSRISEVPLEPGMILSNEPGYYKAGAFGIRIENLIVVQEPPKLGDNRDHIDFETLTYAPIDLRLVDPELLGPGEQSWLNSYHHKVRQKLETRVSAEARLWLIDATRPI